MKNLFKYIKNGPASLIQLGLWTNPEGHVFSGKAALLNASEAAWWPLWRPTNQRATRAANFTRYEALAVQPLTGRRLHTAAWQCSRGRPQAETGGR